MRVRIAIVSDEDGNWRVRRIKDVIHDLHSDEKIYRCDLPIGRKFKTLLAAARVAAKASRPDTDQ